MDIVEKVENINIEDYEYDATRCDSAIGVLERLLDGQHEALSAEIIMKLLIMLLKKNPPETIQEEEKTG